MIYRMPKLVLSIVVWLCCLACGAIHGQPQQQGSSSSSQRPGAVSNLKTPRAAAVVFLDSTRERDGLKGPVRRIETEIERVELRQGALVSKSRELLERTLYDESGRRIENETYPVAGAQIGQETHAYDEAGNLSETIVRDARGGILRRTSYRYELDELGNWTQMIASVAVSNSGRIAYEPVEITKRIITYYLAGQAERQSTAEGGSGGARSGELRQNEGTSNAEGERVSQPQQQRVEEMGDAKPQTEKSAAAKSRDVGEIIKVGVLNGRTTELPKPAYPVSWRRLEVPLTVTVEVTIDITGRVAAARAQNGPEALRDSAEHAARRALFLPFYVAGHPVRAQGSLTYTFDFLP